MASAFTVLVGTLRLTQWRVAERGKVEQLSAAT
jgi:hypothetical protein